MAIRSYPKVYNLGHAAITGMFDDPVIVEEKIDGSQFSFMLCENGAIECRSHHQSIVNDHAGMFAEAVDTVRALAGELKPGWVYRGEYLQRPKHNTIAYDRIPNGHIMIFDINTGEEKYLPYDMKQAEAQRLGLECVPLLFRGIVKDWQQFAEYLERDSVLGGSKVEGVVAKNYVRFGRDGKALMGKYVSEVFKEKNRKDFKKRNPGGQSLVRLIGQEMRSEARWQKAVQHLEEQGLITHEPKDIGPLLKEINRDICEECADEIKERLFQWAWKSIARGATAGFPEWYKRKLAEGQFM